MFAPGRLSLHNSLPVCLSSAKKLGASGDGTSASDSSTPFDVQTNRDVAERRDAATAHVVLPHFQFAHHVELPDGIGFLQIDRQHDTEDAEHVFSQCFIGADFGHELAFGARRLPLATSNVCRALRSALPPTGAEGCRPFHSAGGSSR